MNTRLLASRILSRVLQEGQSLTAALDQAFQSMESGKDKAFIQTLCYGVLRHFHYLDFVLGQLVEKPIKDQGIKALALIGIYQLKFMRVKPHAAVSETVMAARKKLWAKALINAVLRSYQREEAVLDQRAQLHKPAALSHPNWLIHLIEQDWTPEQSAAIFAANNQSPPMVLRVNVSKISPGQYLQQLLDMGMAAGPVSFCPSAIVLEKPVSVDKLPGFFEGWVSVQDTAAQLAAGLLDVQAGQRVLDVCAAPGGKALHILEQQPDLKELLAVDVDAARLQRVSNNLQRLKLHAKLVAGDATRPEDWWDGQLFERILVDAPCSGLGVIRRHPDIKLLRKPSDIEPLQVLQKNILKAIWPLLASGGVLVYATCSVLKQENELQVRAFLDETPDAAELPIDADWGVAGLCGRQIITGSSGMDGFYYARLSKQ